MGNIINTAPCRFCGQMVQIDSEEKLTQPQAEEQATMSCTCEQAVEYQKEKQRKQYNETIQRQQEEIDSLKREIEMLQQECDDRIAEIEQDAAVYAEENRKVDASRQSEDIIKVQTERDTFKALYEQLFERLLTMGGTGN